MPNDKYCRPASLEDLKRVIRALNEQEAEYLLIGGYALFSHGYHRATEDIDLLIPRGEKTAAPIIRALMVLADKAASDIPLEWFEEGENVRLADEIVVDLLFQTCGETFETLKSHAETIDLDGVPVRTLTLEGLLKTKQSERQKDAMDRAVLERAISWMTSESSIS